MITHGERVARGRAGTFDRLVVESDLLADNPLHRFTPALAELVATQWDHGNEFFQPPYGDYLRSRFLMLGGMSPEISKEIGLG